MTAAAPFIGPAIGLAGGLLSASGDIQQGQSAYNAGMYQAAVAMNNASIAKQMATRETQAGQQEAGMESMRQGARLGDVKASQAANGIDVNSGSAVDVQVSQRMLGKLSADTVMNNALLKAYGYQVRAQSDTAQAQLDTMSAQNAKTAARYRAGGDLLGAAKGFFPSGGALSLGNVLPTDGMSTASDAASVEGGALY